MVGDELVNHFTDESGPMGGFETIDPKLGKDGSGNGTNQPIHYGSLIVACSSMCRTIDPF
jgi:hypothetical protein